RQGIETLFAAGPGRKHAEMIGLLEIEHELCAQTGMAISDSNARTWLAGVTGSGKAAKLARALLAAESSSDPRLIREAALEALRGRIERAERWQRIARSD